MSKEGQLQQSEFWLKKYPGASENDPDGSLGIYRVALGCLIDGDLRQTYTPREGSNSPDFWNQTDM